MNRPGKNERSKGNLVRRNAVMASKELQPKEEETNSQPRLRFQISPCIKLGEFSWTRPVDLQLDINERRAIA